MGWSSPDCHCAGCLLLFRRLCAFITSILLQLLETAILSRLGTPIFLQPTTTWPRHIHIRIQSNAAIALSAEEHELATGDLPQSKPFTVTRSEVRINYDGGNVEYAGYSWDLLGRSSCMVCGMEVWCLEAWRNATRACVTGDWCTSSRVHFCGALPRGTNTTNYAKLPQQVVRG